MSSSFSIPHSNQPLALVALDYQEVMQTGLTIEDANTDPHADALDEAASGLSLQEHNQLIEKARMEAASERELHIRAEHEAKTSAAAETVREAIDRFEKERKDYFSRVEAEVIRLALSIAAKILHRESQADPMLVAAIVRIALDRLQESSTVSLTVPTDEAEKWERCMAGQARDVTPHIIGDPHLSSGSCILQADLGSVDFSIGAQLKEVEQSFHDLLSHRPVLQ